MSFGRDVMKGFIKLSAVALSSTALAGCDQAANTDNAVQAAPTQAADATVGEGSGQAVNAMGIGTMQEPKAAVPMLNPVVPPQTDAASGQPKQNDDVLEQPAATVRNVPQ